MTAHATRRSLVPLVLLTLLGLCASCATPEAEGDLTPQRRTFLVQKALRDSLQARRDDNPKLARLFLDEAERLDPGSVDVRRAINALREEMGERPGTAGGGGQMKGLKELREKRAIAEVELYIRKARQLLADRKYVKARQELRAADLVMESLSAVDWGTRRESVRELLEQANKEGK